MLIPLIPFFVMLAFGLAASRFSVWQSQRMLDRSSRLLDDPELGAVATRFARALDLPEVRVHVLEVEPVNGLASHDGRIFLTRGFLRKKAAGLVSAEELGSVIAHELGHVAHGHSRRRLNDVTGHQAVHFVLAGLLNRFIPGLGGLVARLLSRGLMARLSQRDEYEADAWATALMIRAGYGAGPQISLFRKLDSLAGNAAGEVPAWLRSHPRSEDRIRAIEANAMRWRGGDKGPGPGTRIGRS